MKKVALVSDSSSEISQEDARRLGVHIIPNNVYLNGELRKDGVTLQTRDAEFFLAQGGEMQTSPITAEEFMEVFGNLLNDHDEVLCVLVSSTLSQNMANAWEAVQRMEMQHRVTLYDSRIGTIALGRLLLRAKLVIDQGGTVHDAVEQMDQVREVIVADAVVPSLKYFRKGKRVSASRAIIATLLRLCPVMVYTPEGQLTNARTVRGHEGISSLIGNLEQRFGDQPVAITIGLAGEDPDQIARMRQALEHSRLNVKHVSEKPIGASISAHSGPGIYGFVAEPYVEGHLA
ncbi:degV family protein [Deinococcus proteolyticus MRP]|uniref:DegV family protein n=1 Tax=Deinococcus proteolyticus (strain ATCC 35074 / DSM 20540 / JCM 6276 / NBRC 101906 / NCIMB 13154 / VKM Ac-1939 / CCM 2703 / MRP) TaxID=693977 RepID=F0RNF4_DEIPM|nr:MULTISPECIES: DegV family protein [Deinococcus]ADY25256.1 degV family protein [Deinococcus proteolyticus MRP]MCY1703355.1 DegV family EDD domain-containing protein [Deinococcus sp. SL84]